MIHDTTDAYGVDSMAGALRQVAMRRPGAIRSADPAAWHYAKPCDAAAMNTQFDAFVALLEADGATVSWLEPDDDDGLADSIFAFDPSFVIPAGVVILRPGKPARAGEAALHRRFMEGRMPVLGAIVEPYGITVEAYDMPSFGGPEACLHLLSVINPVDTDLSLVHAPLVPVALYQRMLQMGYELLDVPAAEFEASTGLCLNVLPTAPRRCLAIAGFPETAALMRAAGCHVTTFDADELCLPFEGGPTCLTRPLHRALS